MTTDNGDNVGRRELFASRPGVRTLVATTGVAAFALVGAGAVAAMAATSHSGGPTMVKFVASTCPTTSKPVPTTSKPVPTTPVPVSSPLPTTTSTSPSSTPTTTSTSPSSVPSSSGGGILPTGIIPTGIIPTGILGPLSLDANKADAGAAQADEAQSGCVPKASEHPKLTVTSPKKGEIKLKLTTEPALSKDNVTVFAKYTHQKYKKVEVVQTNQTGVLNQETKASAGQTFELRAKTAATSTVKAGTSNQVKVTVKSH